MSWYEECVIPRIINFMCSASPNQKQRQKIVPEANGEILEIGFGSGLNVPCYDSSKVKKIWALEPSDGMRRLAQSTVDESDMDIEFIDLPGEQIPLDDNSVDTKLALEGMRRVLRPGGRLLFCEHGKAPDENVQRWQNRLNPAWRKVAGGCQMNLDIPVLISEGGFDIKVDERMYIPGAKILCYNYWGSAVAV